LRTVWSKIGIGACWPIFRDLQNPGKWPKSKWERLYAPEKYIKENVLKKLLPCTGCVIGCKLGYKVIVESSEIEGEGSFFAKIATSMQLLDVEDYKRGLFLYSLANRAGVCFYTLCRIIDFLTAYHEKGEIKNKLIKDLKLKRDFKTYVDLFNQTINRKGFGDVIADGWIGIYNKLGLNPQDYWYAGVCKGTDFVYDVRAAKLHPLMMTFFTNPRPHHGGAHTLTTAPLRSLEEIRKQVERWGISGEAINRIFTPTYYSGMYNIGRYTRYMEDAMMVNNSLGICSLYTGFGLLFGDELAEIYSSVTGIEKNAGELMKNGERIFNVKKLINIREGFSREDDKVPELWFRPLDTREGREVMTDYYRTRILDKDDLHRLLDDYYDERGWSIETSRPKDDKLQELGIL